MVGVHLPVVARGNVFKTDNKEIDAVLGNLQPNEIVVRTDPQGAESIVAIHAKIAAGEHHVPTEQAAANEEADRKHFNQEKAQPLPGTVPGAREREVCIIERCKVSRREDDNQNMS